MPVYRVKCVYHSTAAYEVEAESRKAAETLAFDYREDTATIRKVPDEDDEMEEVSTDGATVEIAGFSPKSKE